MEIYLSVVVLISWNLIQRALICGCKSKHAPIFFFQKFQCMLSYSNVLFPFGIEFGVGTETECNFILLHSSKSSPRTKFVEDSVISLTYVFSL